MPDETTERMLSTAVRAARAGGELALALREEPGFLRWKGHRDLQAGASLDIQRAIVDVIRAEFPDDDFLLEEAEDGNPDGELVGKDDSEGRLWIIDPICGSWNFNYRIPLFAVGIGCRANGRDEIGVVFDPCNGELFTGAFGQGAQMNGLPIYVKKISDGDEAYRQALVGTDLPGGLQERRKALFVNRSVGADVNQLWLLGSPALGLCYVAAGRLHAYYCLDLQLWDVAAASVILHEAGGTLTDITGGPWMFAEQGQLATNGVIHGGMLRAIKPAMDLFTTTREDRQA